MRDISFVISLSIALFAFTACHAPQPSATKLRVSEGFENPSGFYDAMPTFSWLLPQDGSIRQQTAYRIVVSSDSSLLPDHADLWDSGKIIRLITALNMTTFASWVIEIVGSTYSASCCMVSRRRTPYPFRFGISVIQSLLTLPSGAPLGQAGRTPATVNPWSTGARS